MTFATYGFARLPDTRSFLSLSMVVSFFLATAGLPVQAAFCAKVGSKVNSSFDFVESVEESLFHARLAFHEQNLVEDHGQGDLQMQIDLRVALERSSEDLACAATIVDPFGASADPEMSELAKTWKSFFQAFRILNQKTLKALDSPVVLDPDKTAKLLVAVIRERDGLEDRMFPLANLTVLALTVTPKPGEKDLHTLRISDEQVASLLRKIESDFPSMRLSAQDKDKEVNYSPADGAGELIYLGLKKFAGLK